MGPLIDPGEKLLSLAGDSLFYGEENVVAYGRRVLEEDQAVRWVVVQKKKKPDTYRLFQIHCDSSRKLPDRGHSRGEGVDGCIPYSWKGSAPNPHIEKYNADGPGLHHGERKQPKYGRTKQTDFQQAFGRRIGKTTIRRAPTLKRKIGYNEEQDADERARTNKMRVDDEAQQQS